MRGYWYVAMILLLILASGCIGGGINPQKANSEDQNPTLTSNYPDYSETNSASQTAGSTIVEHSDGEHAPLNITSWAYWLQNASPDEIARSGFKLVVIDYSRDGGDEKAYSREEIESIKRAGKVPIAYISIGEAEDYRFYWNESWFENPPDWLGPENPDWEGNYAVKYWDERWKRIVFNYLDRIISHGFSGVYLDKVDEFEYWGENGYDENWTAEQMIDFILEIADYTRSKAGEDFLIIPQNGERLLEYDDGRLLGATSGWASEDVFYDGLEPSPWTDEKVPYLDRAIKAGKFVLVVDYIYTGNSSPEELSLVKDFLSKARERSYIPYAAMEDRELDELVLIPGIQP
jgi:cysteinyl-tRNA synthetase